MYIISDKDLILKKLNKQIMQELTSFTLFITLSFLQPFTVPCPFFIWKAGS